MTKTFNISCEISLYNDFKQLINSRNEKVSTVIQEFMQSELNQSNRDYEEIERRITALEEIVTSLLPNKKE